MVFDPSPSGGAPSLKSIRNRVSERLELLPRFRERLSATRVGHLVRPQWIPDTTFDVRRHVHQETLPTPGSERELLTWLADLTTRRIDRRLPLWNLTLLPELAEGRWALALKVHHCLTDGVGGAIAMVAMLMDGEHHARTASTTHVQSDQSSVRSPNTLRLAVSGARTLGRILRQRPGPPAGTSLMVPLGLHRHLAFLDMPLTRLEAIRSGLGGTVNDVAITALAGGLRAMFEHREETPLPEYLRILVPVNMRTPSEERSISMNLSFLNIPVPLAKSDLHSRYAETVHTTEAMKQNRRAAGDRTLVDFAALVPPILQRALSEHVRFIGHFDVMVTNVPGPRDAMTFMDLPLHHIRPAVPPTVGHALNATVCSYSGVVTFGFTADRDAVPDLDVVRTGTARALDELDRLANRERSR